MDLAPAPLLAHEIGELLGDHARYRSRTLNLIASENVVSPAVARALRGDLEGRYADYTGVDPTARKYRGGRFVVELEDRCAQLVREVFAAPACELRAISGHVAGNAVLAGFCHPGDLVLELAQEGGGHRLASKLSQAPLIDLRVEFLPFDPVGYNVDGEQAAECVLRRRPRLVILGSSTFLHPHPVAPLRAACTEVGATLAYDASHVMGLIAAGRFQDPLREGADLVFGSTHKTLLGPQGGLIFGSAATVQAAAAALYPPLVTNHHPFRLPALALALCEHIDFGASYAAAVLANACAFARALRDDGREVVGGDTESHTVLIATRGLQGAEAAERLESSGVIANASRVPAEHGGEGLRFGVQELTRRGASADQAAAAAHIVSEALDGADVSSAREELTASLTTIAYTWSET